MSQGGFSIKTDIIVNLVVFCLGFGVSQCMYDRGYQAADRISAVRIASLEARLAEAIRKDGERPQNLVLPEWGSEDFFHFAHEVESVDPLPDRADGFLYSVLYPVGLPRSRWF